MVGRERVQVLLLAEKYVFRIAICQLGPKSRLVFNWYRSSEAESTKAGLNETSRKYRLVKKIYNTKKNAERPLSFRRSRFNVCSLRWDSSTEYYFVPSLLQGNLLQKTMHALLCLCNFWSNVNWEYSYAWHVYNFLLPKFSKCNYNSIWMGWGL